MSGGHTPGPWSAYRGHNPARWFVCGHHYGPEIDISDICELRNDDREANARLIAAAPDLLEALIEALPYVECAEDDPAYKAGAVAKVVKNMRAALAKARQSTPASDCDGEGE